VGLRINVIPRVSAYLSYSHGFRASILDDLTRTGWMWVGPKYANPELGPEYIHNYEAGIDVTPVNRLKFSATIYSSKGKDMLYYVTTGDSLFGRPIYIRENVTNVNMKGAEAEASWSPANNFIITTNFNYAISKIDAFEERPDLEGKYLTYVPKHSASMILTWKNRIVDLNLRGLYKGSQFVSDDNSQQIDKYLTFDMQLSKTIYENFIISFDTQDIFDNRHMETNEYISPGRTTTIRLAVKL